MQDETDAKGTILRRERFSGTMSRSFCAGDRYKTEDIKGKLEAGVLTLSVPKKEETPKIDHPSRIMIEG